MLSLQERIDRLQQATEYGPVLEHSMLHEPIIDHGPNETPHEGQTPTRLVIFESRRRAILKPWGSPKPNSCRWYGQDVHACLTHEVAAWRLAHAIGEPFDQLLPIAVLRQVDRHLGGVLLNWRDGSPDPRVFLNAAAQAHAAGFWDALVGQQDRHWNNFRYDGVARRLALIDHAFSFARTGARNNVALFLIERFKQGAEALTETEAAILEAVLAENLHGLRDFLAEDRAQAFEARCSRMLRDGRLCRPQEL